MKPQSQTKKPGTGDTVSITVSITQDARKKLREMKGILAYPTVDKTVNTAIEMVEMRNVFNIAMEAHGLMSQIEPMEETKLDSKESDTSTHDQPTDEDVETIDSSTDEERKMIDFCKKLLIDLKLEDMKELSTYIDSDIVIIENKLLPKRSPVGEIPEDIEWEEE
jgi:hypothetical protein